MAKSALDRVFDFVAKCEKVIDLPKRVFRLLLAVGVGLLLIWTLVTNAPWQVPAVLAAFGLALGALVVAADWRKGPANSPSNHDSGGVKTVLPVWVGWADDSTDRVLRVKVVNNLTTNKHCRITFTAVNAMRNGQPVEGAHATGLIFDNYVPPKEHPIASIPLVRGRDDHFNILRLNETEHTFSGKNDWRIAVHIESDGETNDCDLCFYWKPGKLIKRPKC